MKLPGLVDGMDHNKHVGWTIVRGGNAVDLAAEVSVANEPVLAGLPSRIAAQGIDVGVSVAVILAGTFANDLLNGTALAGALVAIAYYFFNDGMPNGQSLGKKAMSIRCIASRSGESCGYLRSAARNLCQILGIFDWIWALGASRRRAGDILADTLVVRA
jgi:uncharacterized RDD family membrane protein YckC